MKSTWKVRRLKTSNLCQLQNVNWTLKSDDSSDESNGMEYADLQGFRIVDISVLSSVLASLRCPSCTKGNVCLEEDEESKMGLTSLLILKCTAAKCSYHHSFYTSSKIENKQAFEVNRRVVLA